MKQFLTLLVCGGVVYSCSAAELYIDSLSRNGLLTWTNSVSNATYRVEWAGSLNGPWMQFDALTNLDSIAASNTTVTVTVPMFYRVVWTDPPIPQPVGDWLFNGYDFLGNLVVTGLVSIPTGYQTNLASWSFGPVNATNILYFISCSSGIGNVSLFQFSLNLDLLGPGCGAEGAFSLSGTLLGDEYSGIWAEEGFISLGIGPFVARRRPPNPEVRQRLSPREGVRVGAALKGGV